MKSFYLQLMQMPLSRFKVSPVSSDNVKHHHLELSRDAVTLHDKKSIDSDIFINSTDSFYVTKDLLSLKVAYIQILQANNPKVTLGSRDTKCIFESEDVYFFAGDLLPTRSWTVSENELIVVDKNISTATATATSTSTSITTAATGVASSSSNNDNNSSGAKGSSTTATADSSVNLSSNPDPNFSLETLVESLKQISEKLLSLTQLRNKYYETRFSNVSALEYDTAPELARIHAQMIDFACDTIDDVEELIASTDADLKILLSKGKQESKLYMQKSENLECLEELRRKYVEFMSNIDSNIEKPIMDARSAETSWRQSDFVDVKDLELEVAVLGNKKIELEKSIEQLKARMNATETKKKEVAVASAAGGGEGSKQSKQKPTFPDIQYKDTYYKILIYTYESGHARSSAVVHGSGAVFSHSEMMSKIRSKGCLEMLISDPVRSIFDFRKKQNNPLLWKYIKIVECTDLFNRMLFKPLFGFPAFVPSLQVDKSFFRLYNFYENNDRQLRHEVMESAMEPLFVNKICAGIVRDMFLGPLSESIQAWKLRYHIERLRAGQFKNLADAKAHGWKCLALKVLDISAGNGESSKANSFSLEACVECFEPGGKGSATYVFNPRNNNLGKDGNYSYKFGTNLISVPRSGERDQEGKGGKKGKVGSAPSPPSPFLFGSSELEDPKLLFIPECTRANLKLSIFDIDGRHCGVVSCLNFMCIIDSGDDCNERQSFIDLKAEATEFQLMAELSPVGVPYGSISVKFSLAFNDEAIDKMCYDDNINYDLYPSKLLDHSFSVPPLMTHVYCEKKLQSGFPADFQPPHHSAPNNFFAKIGSSKDPNGNNSGSLWVCNEKKIISSCYNWLWNIGYSGFDPLVLLPQSTSSSSLSFNNEPRVGKSSTSGASSCSGAGSGGGSGCGEVKGEDYISSKASSTSFMDFCSLETQQLLQGSTAYPRVDIPYPLDGIIAIIKQLEALFDNVDGSRYRMETLNTALKPASKMLDKELQLMPTNFYFRNFGYTKLLPNNEIDKKQLYTDITASCGGFFAHYLGPKEREAFFRDDDLLAQKTNINRMKQSFISPMASLVNDKSVLWLKQESNQLIGSLSQAMGASSSDPRDQAAASSSLLSIAPEPTVKSTNNLVTAVAQYDLSCIFKAQRRMVALTQALTVVVSAFLMKLSMVTEGVIPVAALECWLECGFLFVFEILMNMSGSERGIFEDTVMAVESLSLYTIRLNISSLHDSDGCIMRRFSFSGREICINLFEESTEMAKLPAAIVAKIKGGAAGKGSEITLCPIIISQGYNWNQSFMSSISKDNSTATYIKQYEVNSKSFSLLNKYCHKRYPGCGEMNHRMLDDFDKLFSNHYETNKNGKLAAEIERLAEVLQGFVISICKSGKDISSLAVTYNQGKKIARLIYNSEFEEEEEEEGRESSLELTSASRFSRTRSSASVAGGGRASMLANLFRSRTSNAAGTNGTNGGSSGTDGTNGIKSEISDSAWGDDTNNSSNTLSPASNPGVITKTQKEKEEKIDPMERVALRVTDMFRQYGVSLDICEKNYKIIEELAKEHKSRKGSRAFAISKSLAACLPASLRPKGGVCNSSLMD